MARGRRREVSVPTCEACPAQTDGDCRWLTRSALLPCSLRLTPSSLSLLTFLFCLCFSPCPSAAGRPLRRAGYGDGQAGRAGRVGRRGRGSERPHDAHLLLPGHRQVLRLRWPPRDCESWDPAELLPCASFSAGVASQMRVQRTPATIRSDTSIYPFGTSTIPLTVGHLGVLAACFKAGQVPRLSPATRPPPSQAPPVQDRWPVRRRECRLRGDVRRAHVLFSHHTPRG
jgi:hypothetical protein